MRELPESFDNKSISKKLRSAIPKHCSNCGQKYSNNDLSLIKKDEYSLIFHLTCTKCKEAYLINVVSPLGILQGSNRIPVRVDISSSSEAKKFIGSDFISSNDVLDAHNLLLKIKVWKDLQKFL